jgi:hypothetical protein
LLILEEVFMSAQNVITNEIVEAGISNRRGVVKQTQDQANLMALGFILLLVTVVIMSSVLIYMCMSGSGGESMLLLGIFPFTIMFVLLLLSK